MAALLVAAGSAAAPTPAAAPPTHEEYVARAERVCKSHFGEAFADLKRAKHDIQRDKAELGGHELIRAADIFRSMGKRLRAIPKPPEDAETLEEWIKRLKLQDNVLKKAGVALVAGKTRKGQGYLSRFAHNSNAARNVVLGFGFKSCLFRRPGT